MMIGKHLVLTPLPPLQPLEIDITDKHSQLEAIDVTHSAFLHEGQSQDEDEFSDIDDFETKQFMESVQALLKATEMSPQIPDQEMDFFREEQYHAKHSTGPLGTKARNKIKIPTSASLPKKQNADFVDSSFEKHPLMKKKTRTSSQNRDRSIESKPPLNPKTKKQPIGRMSHEENVSRSTKERTMAHIPRYTTKARNDTGPNSTREEAAQPAPTGNVNEHAQDSLLNDRFVAQLETSLVAVTRERDELLLRCQHLQSLLLETEQHMARQAEEIIVLKRTLTRKSSIPPLLDEHTNQTVMNPTSHNDMLPGQPQPRMPNAADPDITFEGFGSIPELLETVGTLRAELQIAKQQLANSRPQSVVKGETDNPEDHITRETPQARQQNMASSSLPSPIITPSVRQQEDQVLEIEMPSMILNRMKKSSSNPIDVSNIIQSSNQHDTNHARPDSITKGSQLPDVDNISFITDALYDDKSMIGSLLDDTEIHAGRSFLHFQEEDDADDTVNLNFQMPMDSRNQDFNYDTDTRYSSTPIPTIQTKDVIFRSPSKDVVSSVIMPHETEQDEAIANAQVSYAKWIPFSNSMNEGEQGTSSRQSSLSHNEHPNSRNVNDDVVDPDVSPTKSFLIRERDALEEELLVRYAQLRQMNEAHTK